MKKDKGQGMVEFALTFSIFIVLVIGILEVAWLFYFYNSISTASREAARYGATLGNNAEGIPHYQDCSGIRNTAKRIAWLAGLQDSDIVIQVDNGPNTPATTVCSPTPVTYINLGDRLSVNVTGHYQPLVNLIKIPNLPLKGVSSYTIMKNITVYE